MNPEKKSAIHSNVLELVQPCILPGNFFSTKEKSELPIEKVYPLGLEPGNKFEWRSPTTGVHGVVTKQIIV